MNSDQVTRCHYLGRSGNTGELKLFLKDCPNIDQALAIIAQYDNTKLLECFDHNQVKNWNWAFTEACHYSNNKVLEYLLQENVDNFDDGLLRAARGGKLANVKKLIELGGNSHQKAFLEAAEHGHVELMIHLKDKFEDIDINQCESALISACYGNQLSSVEYLLTCEVTNYNRGISACSEFFHYKDYLQEPVTEEDKETNTKIIELLQSKL
mgnify:CR=1 FL=1